MGAGMIRTKTVFVIGAGAGFDIGMPLGDALSTLIASKLNIKFALGGTKQESGDEEIMQALKVIASAQKEDPNDYRAAGCNVASGIGFTKSIDSYLNAHSGNEKVKVCAKLAIAQTILEHERSSALHLPSHVRPPDFARRVVMLKSWLQPFMFLLSDRIKRDESLDTIFNNIKIINFNYDRCIEHFLWIALQQLFLIDEQRATSLLQTLPIIHPYGTVGELPWQGGLRMAFGERPEPPRLIDASNRIRTFNEQIAEQETLTKMAEWMSEAERAIYLGFHFHDQNVEILRTVEPARGGMVHVYATAFARSASDVRIIDQQIRHGLAARGGSWNIFVEKDVDCVGLFREYGTAFTQ
jgi:hypothetical protein